MKEYLTALLLTTTPLVAQENIYKNQLWTSTPCGETTQVVEDMMFNLQLDPLVVGQGFIDFVDRNENTQITQGYYTMWTDQDTGIFATTITFSDGITCVLASGSNFEPYTQ